MSITTDRAKRGPSAQSKQPSLTARRKSITEEKIQFVIFCSERKSIHATDCCKFFTDPAIWICFPYDSKNMWAASWGMIIHDQTDPKFKQSFRELSAHIIELQANRQLSFGDWHCGINVELVESNATECFTLGELTREPGFFCILNVEQAESIACKLLTH